jgi:hypothetical protein
VEIIVQMSIFVRFLMPFPSRSLSVCCHDRISLDTVVYLLLFLRDDKRICTNICANATLYNVFNIARSLVSAY